ncbi:PTS sugar transporter subunit IIA [Enterococcus sp. AZ062]|uniref:PTS sugar transporter subunit IIA n=1 Tax=Enterococcus sp. AZ062 TaxID=2774692 RepID=UPI003F2312A3
MSKQLVLVSHGQLCEGLKASTEMIMGPQAHIHTVPLLPEEGTEDFKEKFFAVVSSLEDYVVFCDLMGGTPANTIVQLIMEGEAIELYAGMNMPMVIEFINSQMVGTSPEYVRSGAENILNVNQVIAALAEEDE